MTIRNAPAGPMPVANRVRRITAMPASFQPIVASAISVQAMPATRSRRQCSSHAPSMSGRIRNAIRSDPMRRQCNVDAPQMRTRNVPSIRQMAIVHFVATQTDAINAPTPVSWAPASSAAMETPAFPHKTSPRRRIAPRPCTRRRSISATSS